MNGKNNFSYNNDNKVADHVIKVEFFVLIAQYKQNRSIFAPVYHTTRILYQVTPFTGLVVLIKSKETYGLCVSGLLKDSFFFLVTAHSSVVKWVFVGSNKNEFSPIKEFPILVLFYYGATATRGTAQFFYLSLWNM